ncbi:hypothetical protein D9623_33695 (plasmid) [Azospirillum brasilense]|uniref:Uncharacterized protein n=1 Tax=Azospirillum brasilense TaxID=192 RepID=Q6QW55_AZOBR|nr:MULTISPECIES: hypothetical protein [Azospirillum]YP_001686866.1 hypothetical protein APCd_gp25 [Azospirillum phage Cd]AAS83065.1 hypothetical protein pRhico077 [Azospirillum brasilense]MDW7555396.1 hypothetical protein [Azospirillum brasilense]MDW7595196.1 hypothetical protein [Azospirillum brasilense]MDW7630349.1 hypothetical protein [Azospirillum brasilense]MDX5949717.1 hypothetical protein [Azospirillum brasilense]
MSDDTNLVGLLSVAPEMLCDLIGIEPGHRVIGTAIAADGSVELTIAGPSMPPMEDGVAKRVRMLCTGHASVTARWEHAPDKEWVARP